MNSIEYLQKEYNENKGFLGSSNFEQAKEIHKQEIIDAYMERMDCTNKEHWSKIIGEQYYQETFKK